MTYVRNFENVSPPPRDDNVPFTKVIVRENAVQTFTTSSVIATITLLPVDSDPTSPVPRTFTTANATLPADGWYWLIWEDGAGAQYVSEPTQNTVATELTALEMLIRSHFTMTWDALMNDTYVGLATLRIRIEGVKAEFLPSTLAAQDDDSFSPLLRSYLSKRAALDLIPAGIEYWMRQRISQSTTGTNETTSFTDPVIALRDLTKRLTVDVERLAGHPEVAGIAQSTGEAPAVTFGGDLVTPNPFEFPPAFATDETIGQTRS